MLLLPYEVMLLLWITFFFTKQCMHVLYIGRQCRFSLWAMSTFDVSNIKETSLSNKRIVKEMTSTFSYLFEVLI